MPSHKSLSPSFIVLLCQKGHHQERKTMITISSPKTKEDLSFISRASGLIMVRAKNISVKPTWKWLITNNEWTMNAYEIGLSSRNCSLFQTGFTSLWKASLVHDKPLGYCEFKDTGEVFYIWDFGLMIALQGVKNLRKASWHGPMTIRWALGVYDKAPGTSLDRPYRD